MFDRLRTLGWDFQLGLLAIAGVLLGIPLARTEINHLFVLPELLYVVLAIAGAAVGSIALVGLAALLIDLVAGRQRTWCECRPVSRRNVHEVFELMHRFFGDETPSVTRMLQWQRQNKLVLTAVYIKGLSGGRRRSKLVGVFKIVPLTATAVEALTSERKTGATLQPADIVAEMDEPAGLYIGDVVATTTKAKGEVVRQLKHSVKKKLRPGISVYTRPLTSHGTRLVRKYKFAPVMNDISPGSTGRIHVLPDDQARQFLR
jgi:hypothetical protein